MMARHKAWWVLFGLVSMVSCSSAQKDADVEAFYNPDPPVPAVGQVFTYKHSGPQPWSDGSTDASGKRVVAVMGKTADSKRWRIEERYDAIEGTLVGEYDDKSLL
ncbi:MAG: hypothetical protein RBU29_05220, partial [bacterium]|nr:hypothetical protein [bacterium]